jgi:type VI secretion system secreted protein VgrG
MTVNTIPRNTSGRIAKASRPRLARQAKRPGWTLAALLLSLLVLAASPALAASPGVMHYQGLVTVNGTNFHGAGRFKFALVDGGSVPPVVVYQSFWSHDGTSVTGGAPASALSIPVNRGLYSVMLGDTTIPNMTRAIPPSVFSNPAVYLRVWFDDGSGFKQLAPDQRIGSVAYALQAAGVDAGAVTTAMLADGAVTTAKIGAGAVKLTHIDDGGSIAYEGLMRAAKSVGTTEPLPFEALTLMTGREETAPELTFSLQNAPFGRVAGFTGTEAMSEPYEFVVEVIAPGPELDPARQVGNVASLTLARGGDPAVFAGIVSACSQSSDAGTNILYSFRIESPLAYLALQSGYQVLQELSAVEIASRLYQDAAGAAPVLSLSGSYPKRACAIQYDETTLNFLSRLLEDEGIFYFFRPRDGVGVPALVLGDSETAYISDPVLTLNYYGNGAQNVPRGEEHVREFHKAKREQTKTATLAARDFVKPALPLVVQASGDQGTGEVYRFDGSAGSKADLEQKAKRRLERIQAEGAAVRGGANSPGLRPGFVFRLNDPSGAGLAGDYLVTAVRHAAFQRVTNGVARVYYGNQFEALPASLRIPWRPALKTPKPRAYICTADVTGPTPQQPFVDEHGRVKVRFHWDRAGANYASSSGWVRVSSPMAGTSHGMVFLPRAGDEVLVNFLQGDPDQPVVAGSLFNAVATVPYALPAEASRGTIRSSSKIGTVNELRFDDEAGKEEMRLQSRNLRLLAAQGQISLDDHSASLTIQAPKVLINTSELLVNGGQLGNTNTLVAWGRVAADGSFAGASHGVSSVTTPRPGVYAITLENAATSASMLIPVAVVERNGQPATPAAMRILAVDGVTSNAFNVYVMSGLGNPTNSAFTFMVTGR